MAAPTAGPFAVAGRVWVLTEEHDDDDGWEMLVGVFATRDDARWAAQAATVPPPDGWRWEPLDPEAPEADRPLLLRAARRTAGGAEPRVWVVYPHPLRTRTPAADPTGTPTDASALSVVQDAARAHLATAAALADLVGDNPAVAERVRVSGDDLLRGARRIAALLDRLAADAHDPPA